MYAVDPNAAGGKTFGLPPLFDPADGTTIAEPPSEGDGYWAGAPTVQYDARDGRFLLSYRLRRPRPVRGGESIVAAGEDGIHFEPVWSMRSSDLDSPSIEKCAILRCLDGKLRHYISYVDGQTNQWRVDMLEADRPEELDPSTRTCILTADEINAEGVKDPCVLCIGGVYHMLLSYAPIPVQATDDQREAMHATADIYNTGVTTSETGLATSVDGVNFTWQGNIMRPGSGWDAYCARIGSVLYVPPVWIGFYDGSASVEENYEEQAGLAMGWGLNSLTSITPDGPWVQSAGGSRCVRYVDALDLGDRIHYYYEMARPDGSHELRVSVVER